VSIGGVTRECKQQLLLSTYDRLKLVDPVKCISMSKFCQTVQTPFDTADDDTSEIMHGMHLTMSWVALLLCKKSEVQPASGHKHSTLFAKHVNNKLAASLHSARGGQYLNWRQAGIQGTTYTRTTVSAVPVPHRGPSAPAAFNCTTWAKAVSGAMRL
jgi:hypothetical protein